ncbi:MAG: bifunctional nuclease family protein [Candidatus Nanopelagicales bacterium]|nr:bifunctional nuclease family protein [Candidatus Nanopelagicales bacterium]
MQEIEFIGVRMEMPSNTPIALLKEVDGVRVIPIWIGAVEATAIAYATQDVIPPRPMTHDLITNIFTAFEVTLIEVRISEILDGIFHSLLIFDSGVQISARPSDAIAIALRLGVRMTATSQVLEEAGIEMQDDEVQEEDQLEQFRAFLDEISPEDFQ